MKHKFSPFILGLLLAGSASAAGLYFDGTDPKVSSPLKWMIGGNVIYDDNPSAISDDAGDSEDSVVLNPYVGVTFTNITPQTTIDVYARLGVLYYIDAPDNTDDFQSQSSAGFTLTHRFDERLRFDTRNYVAYETQPDYSQGFAASQQSGEYFYIQTDNSVGYRWTELFGTYTGFRLTNLQYSEISNNDRFTWEVYNQFRYQLNQQAVLTGDYRYSQTNANDDASDSSDQYLLGGIEYSFSANTIGVAKVGAQFHDVDDGEDSTSPYVELALNTQVNQQFSIQSFARYGIENNDNVLYSDGLLSVFDARKTVRFGVSGNYAISPMLSIYGGVDYIPSSYEDGRDLAFNGNVTDIDEDLINAYIGLSVKFNDCLTGTLSYNYTNSDSDDSYRDYDRNRISVGINYAF